MARTGTGITKRHCQCKKTCTENGRRACPKSCSHPDRYQVRKQMPDGSRPTKWFTNREEAERYAAQLTIQRRSHKADEALDRISQSFEEVATEWLTISTLDVEQRTAEEYERIVHNLLIPELGGLRIKDVTQSRVQRLVTDWGAAPQTIHNRMNVLLPILRYGGNEVKVGKRNGGVVLPRRGSESPTGRLFLETTDELRILVNAIDEEYRLLVTFMALVGTRPGEAFELRYGDIVNGQRVQVSRAVTRGRKTADNPSGFRVGDTKTHEQRIVWCPPRLLDEIKAGLVNARSDTLLFSDDGEWLDYDRFSVAFRKARKALPARLGKLRPYDLRHTCASVLANRGASILVVAQQLGHADASVTAKTYAHLFPSAVDTLMGKVDEDVEVVLSG